MRFVFIRYPQYAASETTGDPIIVLSYYKEKRSPKRLTSQAEMTLIYAVGHVREKVGEGHKFTAHASSLFASQSEEKSRFQRLSRATFDYPGNVRTQLRMVRTSSETRQGEGFPPRGVSAKKHNATFS